MSNCTGVEGGESSVLGQEGARESAEGKWCSPPTWVLVVVVIDERAISETGEERTVGSGSVRAGVRVANCLPDIVDPEAPPRRTVLQRGEADEEGGGGTETETEGDSSPSLVVAHGLTVGNTVFGNVGVS